MERGGSSGRWGQNMFTELHVSDHRKYNISSTTNELSWMDANKKDNLQGHTCFLAYFALHLTHLHDTTTPM